jgi:transglutaminase-like putative cysteine protease/uncharacterized protein (DUF58 family)
LTFVSALASGNNLLYLLWGATAGAFAVSWVWLRLAVRGLSARAVFPEALRQGSRFSLRVLAAKRAGLAVHGLRAVRGPEAAAFAVLPGGEESEARLDAELPWRGLNALQGLRLRTAHPFGLLVWSAPVEAGTLALPNGSKDLSWEDVESVCEASGTERPRRGAGDELYGLRPYAEGDEARLMNWKATLRTGRPLVNEFAEPAGAKVTVRVDAAFGEGAERHSAAAAAALERCAGRGVLFRLATPGVETEYGAGRGHLLLCLEALARLGDGAAPRPAPAPPGRPETLPADAPALAALHAAGDALLIAGMLLVDEFEPPLVAAAAAAWTLGRAMDRGRSPRLPAWLMNAASVAVLAYVLLADRRASGITLANTHLMLYMLVNRTLWPLGPAERRQAFGIQFLAAFLISGQTISPWYFPFFLAFCAYAGTWPALALGGGPARAAARRAAPAAAAALAAAAGLFVVTPRIEPLRQSNPFLNLGLDKRLPTRGSVVGFTENVTLGFFGALKRSSARVMRAKPLDGWAPAPEGMPPVPFLMLRGAVMDRFDGRRWTRTAEPFEWRRDGRTYVATEGKAWAPRRSGAIYFPAAGAPGPGLEVTMYPLNSAVVFTAAGLSRLEAAEGSAWFDQNDTAHLGASYVMGTTYRLWGAERPETGFSGALPSFALQLERLYLEPPPGGDPRVAALAAEWTAAARDPEEKIRAVAGRLRGSYRYSLYSEDGRRDLSGFLFDAKAGNCEFFATAAAVLLRHAGVPTRLVAGFLADDWNEYGGFFDVRQGQAHAWVEAWDGRGWRVVDATPPASGPSGADRWLAKARRWATAAQLRWYRDVIGYDSYLQRDAARRARLAVARARLEGALEAAWPAVKALAALALFAAAVAAAAGRRGGRRARRTFDEAAALLEAAGDPRRLDQTAREYAGAAAAARPGLAPAAELAELHYRELYDPRGLGPGERARAAERLKALKAELRRPGPSAV